MRSLEAIIQSVAGKFGLGDKAALLLSEILSLITDEYDGGLSGFVDRMRRAGLGELVGSWIKIGPNNPISENELERALGSQVIGNIASRVGVAQHVTKSALASMLPDVVDFLTPHGSVPSSIPAEVRSFIRQEERARVDAAHHAAEHRSSPLRWLLPLLGLLLVAFLGYRFCNRPKEEVAVTPAATRVSAVDSWLTLINEGGKLGFSGLVPDEKTRQEILDKLKAAFGEGNYLGEIKIDPNAGPVTWLSKLGDILAALTPGVELSIDGNTVHVAGDIPADKRVSLLDKLRALFGSGFNIKEGLLDIEAKVKDSIERTLAALRALTKGSSSDELVKALNLHIIHFATGKSDIPPANQEVLKESAKAIKNASAGTVLGIGGHTDDIGSAEMNQKLSESRANAVRDFLIEQGVKADALVAKGYGETTPVASNATPEGRFANRRMEFEVVK